MLRHRTTGGVGSAGMPARRDYTKV